MTRPASAEKVSTFRNLERLWPNSIPFASNKTLFLAAELGVEVVEHMVYNCCMEMIQERRGRTDRRTRPTPMFSRYALTGGRRAGGRRDGETAGIYVDRIGRGLSILLLLTFLFHCLDALFTLVHVSHGGRELNPFMDYFLRAGPGAFVLAKLGMAALGLCFLGVHQNFPMVKKGIGFLCVLYAGVIAYHLVLMLRA